MPRNELSFLRLPDEIQIRGDTYPWRVQIKALEGARWDPKCIMWRVPATTNIDELIEVHDKVVYGDPPRCTWGRCCSHAKLEDSYYMGPLCYRCPKHGVRSHGKKAGYTGD